MTLQDWKEETSERVKHEGIQGVLKSLDKFGRGAWRRALRVWDPGTDFTSKEWDILVVMDACRYDTFSKIGPEYGFEGSKSVWSIGSQSREWMNKTFDEQPDLAYVTGNPFSSRALHQDQFQELDEVWRYSWDDDTGTILPDPITDRAIDIWRNEDVERMVVHYMQPHHPFVPNRIGEGFESTHKFGRGGSNDPWKEAGEGDMEKDELMNAYEDNLRYILQHLDDILLENVDGKVVLTSDHGNAIGEFGVWGHPSHVPIPPLRKVPWEEIQCDDYHSYIPGEKPKEISEETENRLQDLGYM